MKKIIIALAILLFTSPAFAAYTMTFGAVNGNWSDGTKWSGGDGTNPPTTADSVILGAASATSITIDAATNYCHDFDASAYPAGKTLTHTAAKVLNVSGSFTMAGGFTYTKGNSTTSSTTFSSTSAGEIITLGGHALGNVTFDGVNGVWTFQDVWSNGNATITVTNGSVDFNDQAATYATLSSSNANTRTITFGAGTLTPAHACSGYITFTNSTGLTFNAGHSLITCTAGSPHIDTGGKTFYDVSITTGGTTTQLYGGGSFHNLSITPSGVTAVAINANFAVTGTFTLTGVATARGMLGSSAFGTQRTITVSNPVASTDFEFRDIVGATTGSGSWDISANPNSNCFNNSGIIFMGGTNIYWVHGASASYDWWTGGRWMTMDGGSTPARVPLTQDTAKFTGSSFGASGKTVSINAQRVTGNLDFSAVTNSPTITWLSGQWYGSTISVGAATFNNGGANYFITTQKNNFTITSNGYQFGWNINTDTGFDNNTMTLADAFDGNGSDWDWRRGEISSIYNITLGSMRFRFTANGKKLTHSATMTLTGTGDVYVTNGGGTTTLTTSSEDIVITNTSATGKNLAFNTNQTVRDITLAAGSGTITISGAHTFRNVIKSGTGTLPVVYTKTTTYTMTGTDWFNSSDTNLTTITSNTAGSVFTLAKSSGTCSAWHISLKDCTASGAGATFNATDSTNVSGNSANWNWLTSGVTNTSKFFMLF